MLSKGRRVSKTKDWQRLQKFSRTLHSPAITLRFGKNNLPLSRFGFIVSTKISKKATKRNKVKRQLRAIIAQENMCLREGYDIVFLVRPPAMNKSFVELHEMVTSLLDRAGLILKKT